MNLLKTLDALERERELLEEFICLSEEQLLLLGNENLDGFDALLQQRSGLMRELADIEFTLTTWIRNIQTDPSVTPATFAQMSAINDEIVRMANHVVEIDERAHRRLEQIREGNWGQTPISAEIGV